MQSFDYIIVGAGSAGCVLANRLSADPSVRVLLLEAGGNDRSPNIKIPAAFAKQFHTKLDWDFATEPEPHVDGRSLYIPRGKGLGGSSSMNAMLYVRGRPLDYDAWEAQGAPGWGYQDVLPYFMRSEDNVRGASQWHGAGGPLRVSEQRSPRPLDRRLIAASEAAGIPWIADYNGPEQDGVSMFQVTQSGGRRFSSADAFLRPALDRPNLELRTRATVLGIELEGTRAVGVRVRSGRRRRRRQTGDRAAIPDEGHARARDARRRDARDRPRPRSGWARVHRPSAARATPPAAHDPAHHPDPARRRSRRRAPRLAPGARLRAGSRGRRRGR